MKIAYLITAHAYPDHFIRMIKRLANNDSYFFVHIDKKSDISPFLKVEQAIDKTRIIWLKRRSHVWAGFNAIRTTVDGMRQIANYHERIDYVSCISGQHYPLRPVSEFHQYLAENMGKSFIEYSRMPRPMWGNGGMDRIGYYHLIFRHFRIAFPLVSYLKVKLLYVDPQRFVAMRKVVRWLPSAKKFPRRYLTDCKPFEGSNWFTLHIDLVREILRQIDNDGAVYRFYKYTHVADEMFFQSLILNKLPRFANTLDNNNLTFIKWDESTGRPFTLTEDNIPELSQSKDFLARKFEPALSGKLLAHIDESIERKANHSHLPL